MNRILLSCEAGLGIVLLLAFLTGAAFAFQGDMSGAQTPVPGDTKDSVRQAHEKAQQMQMKARQAHDKAQKARSHILQFQCRVQCVKDNAGRTEEERAQICSDACPGSDQK